MEIIFCTSNPQKFAMGDSVCKKLGIKLIQQDSVDLDEVQSEDPHYVAVRKAKDAFKALGRPLLVSDDSWQIHGLKGFPGVYAKSVNEWFTPEDFIRLTRDLGNRTVSLVQKLVYKDEHQLKAFTHEVQGVLLKEAQGHNGSTIQKVVSFEKDDSLLSVSEALQDEKSDSFQRSETLIVWQEFADWFASQK
jgi:XTP/dITP diphosphohydrolase